MLVVNPVYVAGARGPLGPPHPDVPSPPHAPDAASTALSPPWHTLPAELLHRILVLLPLDDRAAAGAVCTVWHTTASRSSLWTSLDLSACAPQLRARLTDSRLACLLATAHSRAAAGVELLDVSDCRSLSQEGMLAACRTPPICGSVRHLRAMGDAPLLSAGHMLQLKQCCSRLVELSAGCHCPTVDAALVVLAQRSAGVRIARLELLGLPLLAATDAMRLAHGTHAHGTHLTALSLAGCHIGDEACTTLLGSLRGHAVLRALNLDGCGLGPDGCTAVAAAIQHNALPLRSLRLGHNALFADGARSLAAALQRNTSLVSLSLGSCSLGAVGAKFLAAALRHNSSLQWLELNNDAIGDVGATALADAIAAGATQQQSGPGTAALRTLRLRHNAISDEGFMALANALMANPPLSELDVRLNTAHGAGASALVSSLSDNTHCSCLLLSGNMLTRDEAVKLQRVAAGRVRAAEQWLLDSDESTSVDSSTRSSGSIMWWADVTDVVLMGDAVAVAIPMSSDEGEIPAVARTSVFSTQTLPFMRALPLRPLAMVTRVLLAAIILTVVIITILAAEGVQPKIWRKLTPRHKHGL